jgi:hypothetical protein
MAAEHKETGKLPGGVVPVAPACPLSGMSPRARVRFRPLVLTLCSCLAAMHTGPIHFMSQDNQPLHFGLVRNRVAETVEITWPGGRRQVLHDVTADRILSVREETEP